MSGASCPDAAGRALADAAERALPGWVERSVRARLGRDDSEVLEAARHAGEDAVRAVVPELRRLLGSDIDEQATTPLELLRAAVRYPTEVLRAAGVPAVERDEFVCERFPDDPYDLTPATFADVDVALVQPGIEWGAAKAWTHKRRRTVR